MSSTPTSATKGEDATRPAGERLCCWQCGAECPATLFCPTCGAIQPLPDRADYFQVLGIPQRLVVDAEALQKRYYELHRVLHPDRYQTGPQPARSASLRNTAAVNRAYSTLRNPVERGEYWLALHGETLGANNSRVPADMAALVFDVQEKLEELRTARRGNGHAALAREVAEAHAELLQRHAALLDQLHANFARWDAGNGDTTILTRELKAILSALAYLGTLIRSVEKELES